MILLGRDNINIITSVMLLFSLLGALDRILGNKFGLGGEFEKGFTIIGNLALSMIGMIVISPLIADLLEPFFEFFYSSLGIDPSIIPASLFANDMGGASLAQAVSKNASIGLFSALIVSSMMGCTVSFILPYSINAVEKKNHSNMLIGLLCGILTIPIGCLVSGLVLEIKIGSLLLTLLPLIIFSLVIAVGIILFRRTTVAIFKVIAVAIKILITVGLALGILNFLTGREIVKGLASIEEGALICFNASVVMSGAFPLIYTLSRILSKPIKALSNKTGLSEKSAIGFISTLATSVTTFDMMKEMDTKGIILNSAFAVSASFVLADHLAFTMAYNADYIFPMMLGKVVSGIAALVFAALLYKYKLSKEETL